MEEKKLDVKSIIGFVLIFGILLGWMYLKQPSQEELAAEKAKQEQLAAAKQDSLNNQATSEAKELVPQLDVTDSVAVSDYQQKVGAFGVTQVSNDETVLENDVLFLKN